MNISCAVRAGENGGSFYYHTNFGRGDCFAFLGIEQTILHLKF